MPHLNGVAVQYLLKVSTKLWTVVCLHHSKTEATGLLRPHNDSGSYAWSYVRMHFCIRHPTVQIYDRIDIPSLVGFWTDVMNGVGLYELTRLRW